MELFRSWPREGAESPVCVGVCCKGAECVGVGGGVAERGCVYYAAVARTRLWAGFSVCFCRATTQRGLCGGRWIAVQAGRRVVLMLCVIPRQPWARSGRFFHFSIFEQLPARIFLRLIAPVGLSTCV